MKLIWFFVVLGVVVLSVVGWYVDYGRGSKSMTAEVVRTIGRFTWRMRRSAEVETSVRKTGRFVLANGVAANYCEQADGTIMDEYKNYTNTYLGWKYMTTHLVKVNDNGTISVYVGPDGKVGVYTPKTVTIITYPEFQKLSGTVKDLESGDCLLLLRVEGDQPVDVQGVR